MWRYSSSERCLECSGEREKAQKASAITIPAPPMRRNIARQPKASVSIVSSGGANAEPHFEPESPMPAAGARSSRGNHWGGILLEFGEVGHSAVTSRTRQVWKW